MTFVHLQQRIVGVRRLDFSDIEACASNPALVESPDQRGLVYRGAAAVVDEQCCRLHALEVFLGQHVVYLGSRRCVHRDEV